MERKRPSKQEEMMSLCADINAELKREGRFMTALEIMHLCNLEPATTIQALDALYRANALLKQFQHEDKSVIVAFDEVTMPEIGYSRTFDRLLATADITPENFEGVVVSYGVRDRGNGGGPECAPLPPSPSVEIPM